MHALTGTVHTMPQTKEEIRLKKKQWKEKNKDKLREQRRQYYLNVEIEKRKLPHVREKKKQSDKKYNLNNKEKRRAYKLQEHVRVRRHRKNMTEEQINFYRKKGRIRMQKQLEDPRFRVQENLRHLLRYTLKSKTTVKSQRTYQYLGCDLQYFVSTYWPEKIKAWNDMYPNHPLSVETAVIDHIKPRAKHDDTEMHACNHYTNLQPLPPSVNADKSDKWGPTDEIHWREHIIFNETSREPYLPASMRFGLD